MRLQLNRAKSMSSIKTDVLLAKWATVTKTHLACAPPYDRIAGKGAGVRVRERYASGEAMPLARQVKATERLDQYSEYPKGENRGLQGVRERRTKNYMRSLGAGQTWGDKTADILR